MPIDKDAVCCRGHGLFATAAPDAKFADETTPLKYAPDLLLEPTHMRLDLSFDFPVKKLMGKNTLTLKCNRESRTLQLNAISFANVHVHDASEPPVGLDYRYDGTIITVTWSTDLKKGSVYKIVIDYVVENPVSGLFFSAPDSSNPNRPFFVATDNESERSRYWLPSIDAPIIRTSYDFHISAPEHLTIVANGLLQSEKIENGTKVAHWSEKLAFSSYLTSFAVGEFIKVDDSDVHGIPISYYAPKDVKEADLRRSFQNTRDIILWMEKKLGMEYPFSKQAHISLPVYPTAMENVTLITWNDRYVLDEVWIKEFFDSTNMTNVHELAHTYFGDLVSIRHFDHVWLKESWANFMEQQYAKEIMSPDEGDYDLFLSFQRYSSECSTYKRPIVTRKFESSWDMYDRHTYPGGCCRLHMLEMMLGSETFWAAVSKYLKKYAHRFVETEDFRKELEAESGLNLVPFFDRWIYGIGYPVLKGSFSFSAQKKTVKIGLQQTQDDLEKKLDPKNLFAMDIEVTIVVGDKKDTPPEARTTFTQVISFDGNSNKSEAVFSGIQGHVLEVHVDPRNHYVMSLEFNPGLDILTQTARHHPSVIGRIRAIQEIAKISSPQSFKVIQELISLEKFYGVRIQAANALAKTKSGMAIPVLAWMIQKEDNFFALSEIVLASNSLVHPRIRAAFLSRIPDVKDCGSFPYRALGRLLHALGLQHAIADLPLLLQYAEMNSLYGLVQNGALRGLSQLARHHDEIVDDVLKYLKRRSLPYDADRPADAFSHSAFSSVQQNLLAPESVRPAALYELGVVAAWLEPWKKKRVVAFLREQLTTESLPAAKEAAHALISLGAKEATADIRGIRARLPTMEHPEFDKKLRRLSTADASAGESRREVEELQKRLQKAEEHIQELRERAEQASSKKD